MRIVELSTDRIPSPPKKGGAIERYVYQISQELSRLGVEVHLISTGNKYYIEKDDTLYRHVYPAESTNFLEKVVGKALAIVTSEYNKKLFYVNRILLRVLREIHESYGCVDVVHNHYFTTAFAPIVFRKTISNRTILITHYHNVPEDNLINRMLARYYDVHLAVSKFVRDEVIRRLGVDLRKVKVVYNAIDTSKFTCEESAKSKVRGLYGIPEDNIVLLYVGRITYEKGLHHLVEAFRVVRENMTDISRKLSLLIVGPIGQFDSASSKDIAYFRYIQKISRERGLHENIRYLGYAADITDIYALADVVVVPSIWQDPCPSTVLEALASCRPVVAYPVGGIPELVKGLEYDFLAKAVEPRSLAEKIMDVIRKAGSIDLRSLRNHVERKFSTKVVARTLKSLFEELLYESQGVYRSA